MKIESFIPGRMRLRSVLFKDGQCADLISRTLMSIEAVRSASVNELSGGMLLEYDPSSLPIDRLISAAPLFERLDAIEAAPPADRPDALRGILSAIRDAIETRGES